MLYPPSLPTLDANNQKEKKLDKCGRTEHAVKGGAWAEVGEIHAERGRVRETTAEKSFGKMRQETKFGRTENAGKKACKGKMRQETHVGR